MTPDELVAAINPIVELFEELGIRYQIGGSVASSVYGIARATLDAAVMADLSLQHIAAIVEKLQGDYYIDERMMQDAVRRRASFNVIHLASMIKVDIFVPKLDAFVESTFKRSVIDTLADEPEARTFRLTSPEDLILRKLAWYQAGGEVSERQWNDVLGVIKVQGQSLDRVYLEQWASTLGLGSLLATAFRESGLE